MLKDLATEYNFVKKKVANTYKLAPTILQDASQNSTEYICLIGYSVGVYVYKYRRYSNNF